jgi:putative flippase GtrA
MLRQLSRQLLLFVLIGLMLVLVDWAVFSALFYAGLPLTIANVIGRIVGACLGFYLNGRVTFAQAGVARLGRERLLRFVVAWILLTLLGTLLMHYARQLFGSQAPYLAKPLIEAFLAGLSFFSSRFFVYR